MDPLLEAHGQNVRCTGYSNDDRLKWIDSAFRRSLAFAWRRFQAETFDKVVRMVIIGHHCPTITTSSCRIQFNNGNSEANDAPHRRVQTSKVRSPRCQGSELGSPPISCLPCSPSHVYLIHGPYTSQVSAHTRFRAMCDFSICRRPQQHCPSPTQERRAQVKFLWCAVCALARLMGLGLWRWHGGWVGFRSVALGRVRMHIENACGESSELIR